MTHICDKNCEEYYCSELWNTEEHLNQVTQQTIGIVRKILNKYNGFNIDTIIIKKVNNSPPKFNVSIKYEM